MPSKSTRASAPSASHLSVVPLRPSAGVEPVDAERRRQLVSDLDYLADGAAAGEIIGLAYVVIRPDGATQCGLLAEAADNRALAHFGISRLADMALWPEKYRPVNGPKGR